MHFSLHFPRQDERGRAPMEFPTRSSLKGTLCHGLLVVHEADCRDRRSLSQSRPKSGTMPPDLPSNEAESPDNSRLNLEPQPSDSNTNGGSNPKHLPSEVLIFIAQNCQDKDLGKLCLVSKHMQSIARQELYRTVVISTDTRLSRFYRTIEEEPVFGQYYVEELKCLAPVDVFRYTKSFVGTLKRLPNLRRLTIALVGRATTVFPSPAIWEVRFALGDSIWDIFTRSQRLGSTSAVLPRLQQVRLIPDTRSQNPHERLSHARVLNPFLRLPSLSHLELLNDSGVWTRNFCLIGPSKQTTSKQQSIKDPRQII